MANTANTNDGFKKAKVTALFSTISTAILCIQHFWGIFAPTGTVQVAYIPLIVTFIALITSEAEGNYPNKKWIMIVSGIGIAGLALVGFSISTIVGYGITEFSILSFKWTIDDNLITKFMYSFITLITCTLTVLGIKKIVEV